MKPPSAESRRLFTASIVAREVLRDAAHALGERKIPVMPLKGVLFQHVLYADPTERDLRDVDVLVPEARFPEAIEVLLQRGFEPRNAGRSWIEVGLRSPRGLPLDLHRRLFCSFRYRMPTDDVFRRAAVDSEWLGAPLWLPDPRDAFAHLVGKFVSDHVPSEARPRLLELGKLAQHFQLEAAPLARHLVECGLARAARHVLGQGARELGEPIFEAVLRELPDDPLGQRLVTLADLLEKRFTERSRLASLSAHLLNTSLPRGATSLGMAALYAARHAQLTRARGAGGGYWAPFFSASSSSALRKASSARRS